MTLQDLFYIVGLMYMSMGIVLLIALVFAVFYIKKRVDDMHKTFDDKLGLLGKAIHHPAESAVDLGASFAEAALEKVKEVIEKKKAKN
ncbi:MAG: hypothetical protein ACM3IJ_05645 [Candidatus Levyibacteriota bacterium]